MKLKKILNGLKILDCINPSYHKNIHHIFYDSRQCVKKSLFVAIKGYKYNGHNFIMQAIENGAEIIIIENEITFSTSVMIIKVQDSRKALSIIANNFYKNPSQNLYIIGITGTSGKTTISYLLESILNETGIAVGVIGTINYRYNNKIFSASNTTPESLDLQKILQEMLIAGITHVIMEVSSHSLDLGRVEHCLFDIGIFSNLSIEHLDYHKNIENYFLAKQKLFQKLEKNSKNFHKNMIINIDDFWGKKLFNMYKNYAISFGIKNNTANYSAFQIKNNIKGINAIISEGSGSTYTKNFTFYSSMIGSYNIYNILAAVIAAKCLKIKIVNIKNGISKIKNIPGRLEKISFSGEPLVFVDYSHKPDALKKVLKNISIFKRNNQNIERIITILGCGGERDKQKRPLMGNIATIFSDLTILTSDNPRSENPLDIIKEIETGINYNIVKYNFIFQKEVFPEEKKFFFHKKKSYVIILDRKIAIITAIKLASKKDIILIAGKGHEDYQLIGNQKIPFNDKIEARKILSKIKINNNI